jgi:predicted nuclease of predicted toxin-antitoxin system
MKLLFDQNLSPRLPHRLADAFPDSSHVAEHGLDTASDLAVWDFAKDQGFVIVTRDADFGDMGALRSFPPKVIRIRPGNSTTGQIEDALRSNRDLIDDWSNDPGSGVPEIY